jgi:hypothetical protein
MPWMSFCVFRKSRVTCNKGMKFWI